MENRPYIGVTGITSYGEAISVLNEFENAKINFDSSHIPMMGFLVSSATLGGQRTNDIRYPDFKKLGNIFENISDKVFPTIHYYTPLTKTVSDQVSFLFREFYQNNLCRGLQLNIIQPKVKEFNKIKNEMPDLSIIFQINNSILSLGTPKEVVNFVKDFENFINYALIDSSGGKGLDIDLDKSIELYNLLRESMPKVCFGFAGGFNGNNIEYRVRKILEQTKSRDFCIDAESGLRDKLSKRSGHTLLNIDKVKSYLCSFPKV